jgi:HK97 gp10 family phage protein
VRIKGVDQLKRKLRAMPQAAKDEIRKALEASAQEITGTAKNFAPSRTGALRNSIGYSMGREGLGTGNELSVTVHAGDDDAYYAPFVEFGTSRGASARPFFFPAYRLVKKRVKSRISRATSKAAKKVAAGS